MENFFFFFFCLLHICGGRTPGTQLITDTLDELVCPCHVGQVGHQKPSALSLNLLIDWPANSRISQKGNETCSVLKITSWQLLADYLELAVRYVGQVIVFSTSMTSAVTGRLIMLSN